MSEPSPPPPPPPSVSPPEQPEPAVLSNGLFRVYIGFGGKYGLVKDFAFKSDRFGIVFMSKDPKLIQVAKDAGFMVYPVDMPRELILYELLNYIKEYPDVIKNNVKKKMMIVKFLSELLGVQPYIANILLTAQVTGSSPLAVMKKVLKRAWQAI